MNSNDAKPRWRDMDAEERALAYSPSKALPDGDLTPYIDAYVRDSAEVHQTYGPARVLEYGDAPSQTIDLFLPKDLSNTPLHIFIHGGYWQALSKTESCFAAAGFLENGVGFAAIDYTLAPKATLDEIIAETLNAVSYLFENAQRLGIDPTRISISGSSAGAHLAAMTCLGLAPEQKPNSVILFSGIFELEPLIGTYVNDPLHLDIPKAQKNSPLLKNLNKFPKALIAWGEIETDEFKRQSQYFAGQLPHAETFEIPHRNHFDVVYELSNGSPLAQRVLSLVTCKGM